MSWCGGGAFGESEKCNTVIRPRKYFLALQVWDSTRAIQDDNWQIFEMKIIRNDNHLEVPIIRKEWHKVVFLKKKKKEGFTKKNFTIVSCLQ